MIVGNVKRDNAGVPMCPTGKDLDDRRVTQMGYLLDEDGNIVSSADPNCIIFKRESDLVNRNIPAPHLFERFNFSAFDILGRFSEYDYKKEVIKKTTKFDEQGRQTNWQGLYVSNQGHLLNFDGQVVLNKKYIQYDLGFPPMYNWQGK
jgi:hypothetical protein